MRMGIIPLFISSILSLTPLTGSASESVPKKPIIHTCKKTDKPVDILACNIFMEARGENASGQMAIGFVTLNRLKNDKYPQTMGKVVYQKAQFSWVDPSYNYRIRDAGEWKVAKDIAKFLYSIKDNDKLYARLDITYGSTYFHSRKTKPYWSKMLKKTTTIGGHVFYKLKET